MLHCNISEVFDKVYKENNDYVLVECDRYDLVYGLSVSGNCVEIVRMIPRNGYVLFEVSGSFAKKLSAAHMFLAKNPKDAKKQYENLYGWKASSYRAIPPSDEAKSILEDINRMPL